MINLPTNLTLFLCHGFLFVLILIMYDVFVINHLVEFTFLNMKTFKLQQLVCLIRATNKKNLIDLRRAIQHIFMPKFDAVEFSGILKC